MAHGRSSDIAHCRTLTVPGHYAGGGTRPLVNRPASGFGSDEGASVGGQVWQALALATSFGLTVALLVAGGVLGGRWLDGRVGTSPLFAVVGLFLGLGIGGFVFIRQVTRILGGSGRDG